VLLFLEGLALLIAFASAMIWLGLWLGALVRSPDAVMGIGFVIVFPITFLSNAFVPLNTLPSLLQWIASVNPISVLVAAVRTLFGNPLAPVTKHTWPIDHPVAASWLYVGLLLALGYLGAQRQYRHRTTE
jgi:ABC-2 type transport system permease protein